MLEKIHIRTHNDFSKVAALQGVTIPTIGTPQSVTIETTPEEDARIQEALRMKQAELASRRKR